MPVDPTVRTLTGDEVTDLLRTRGPAGFLPAESGRRADAAGATTHPDTTEPVGWFADGPGGAVAREPVGAALVRRHTAPRRTTVVVVDGPDLDWAALAAAGTTTRWLAPLVTRLRDAGADRVSMTPPVPVRVWHAATVSDALLAAAAEPGTHPGTAAPVPPAVPAVGAGFPLDVSDRDAFPADEPVRQARTVGDLHPDDRGQPGTATAAQLASGDWRPATGPRPHRAVLRLAGSDEGGLWAGQARHRQELVQRAEATWVRVDSGEQLLDDTAGLVALPLLPGGPATDRTTAALWTLLAGFGDRRRLMVARRDDRVLAAVVTAQTGTVTGTGDGPGITEGVLGRWAAGPSPETDSEVSGAVAVLTWQLVRAARADGAAALDLGPVDGDLDPHAPATAGLHEAVAVGADVVELTGEWSLVLDRRGESVRRLAHRLFTRH